MPNEDSGGAGMLQLNHTVLNMTLDSARGSALCGCSVVNRTTGLNDRLKLVTEQGTGGRGSVVCVSV